MQKTNMGKSTYRSVQSGLFGLLSEEIIMGPHRDGAKELLVQNEEGWDDLNHWETIEHIDLPLTISFC